MITNSQILSVVTFVYGLAALLYIISWIFQKEAPGRVATWVTLAACVGNAVGIAMRWYESYNIGVGYGHAPLSNIYESLVFFALTIGLIYLVIERRYQNRTIGAFVLPLAFFALAYASLHTSTQIQPLIPALKSNWLIAHVIACFIGYAAFALAFGASILYLIKNKTAYTLSRGQEIGLLVISIAVWTLSSLALTFLIYKISLHLLIKLPGWFGMATEAALPKAMADLLMAFYEWIGVSASSPMNNVFAVFLVVCGAVCALFYIDNESPIFKRLPDLKIIDELTHQLIMFGFLFLSVGIITGAVWANSAWGRYWGWDPKETWSFITWLIYAALLHFRMMRGWQGARIAAMSIIGFVAVLFTYFGVNLLPGLHSYGAFSQ
jgi:cytochrome c-type biogenesis protein CcsB